MKKVILIISCIILLLSIGTFGYLYYQNSQIDNELNSLHENINKVKEKINQTDTEIEEKQTEYEKLEKEMKDKLEELNIWKETTEKLEKALS